jgi:hypothetical protein
MNDAFSSCEKLAGLLVTHDLTIALDSSADHRETDKPRRAASRSADFSETDHERLETGIR